MADDLVPIATFVTPAQAAAARCALEAQGIVSFLKDDHLVGMNWLLGNAVGYVKLVVAAADAERARAMLDTPFDDWPGYAQRETWTCRQCGEETDRRFDHCRHCGIARHPADTDDVEVQAFTKQLADDDRAEQRAGNPYASPRSMSNAESPEAECAADEQGPRACCPSCGKPRVAVCPYCRTSGGHFRAAENFDGEMPADEPEMLICPTCDEPFDAVYFRVCDACGHDFGSGLEAPPVVPDRPAEPLNWRVIAVGLGGIAVVAGLGIYFAFILS